MAPLRIGLVSDTHGLLRPGALAFLQGCDLIIHGGDIGNAGILEALARLAPLTVVRGNNDNDNDNDNGHWAVGPPETAVPEAGGVMIHALHDLARRAIDPAAAGIRLRGVIPTLKSPATYPLHLAGASRITDQVRNDSEKFLAIPCRILANFTHAISTPTTPPG